jgi:pSer/pThr/pTyr-binding forkhead associated (FHA) protein
MLPLPRLGATLIGRYPDVGLHLSSRKVSGHHCRVFYADYHFFIEDLASTNGTFVNKVKLPAYTKQEIRHGDSIRVGDIQLFFQDRLVAFLAELKSPLEQRMVIERLKTGAGQNLEAALTMLATLLQSWIDRAEAGIAEATVLLAYNLLEDRPLAGIELLLKTTKPGEGQRHDRVYWALSRLMTQAIEILPESLGLVIHLTVERPVILLHRISQATPPGDFKNFFKVCETLFSQGDYTRSDLERLVNNLKYLSEGVEAKERLSLYQALFKMRGVNTITSIAAFRSYQFVKKANTSPAQAVQWLQRLVEVAQAAHQAGQASKSKDKLTRLTKAISVLNELERETELKPQEPELTLYSEILFRWRWIILSEQDQLRGY